MKTYFCISKEPALFPIGVVSAGIGHPQEPISHPEGAVMHQVFVVQSGSGEIHIEGKLYPLEKGDMFFLPAYTPHSYRGYHADFATAFFGFTGDGCSLIFDYYDIKAFCHFKRKDNGHFLMHLQRVLSLCAMPDNLPALSAEGYAALVAFFDEVTKKEYTPIEKVYHYLESHYHEEISLDDIGKIFPFSKSKLCSDFSAKYGMSVFEMLNKIRLRNARYMLTANPAMKLKSVAEACGFHDTSYFCKLYKREYRKTPKSK